VAPHLKGVQTRCSLLDTRVFNVPGGPQVHFPNQTRSTPFLRVLFGVANTRFKVSSSTQPATGGNVTTRFRVPPDDRP
jgi:hypothetical protein